MQRTGESGFGGPEIGGVEKLNAEVISAIGAAADTGNAGSGFTAGIGVYYGDTVAGGKSVAGQEESAILADNLGDGIFGPGGAWRSVRDAHGNSCGGARAAAKLVEDFGDEKSEVEKLCLFEVRDGCHAEGEIQNLTGDAGEVVGRDRGSVLGLIGSETAGGVPVEECIAGRDEVFSAIGAVADTIGGRTGTIGRSTGN